MIGFFGDSKDSKVIAIVRDAAAQAAPGAEFRVIEFKRRSKSETLKSREFLAEISNMGACVIDGDLGEIADYSAEMGSLAAGMAHMIGSWGADEHAINDLDRRVAFLTREPQNKWEPSLYFEKYYTIFSLNDIPILDQVGVLSQWFRDTLDRSAPKVFVSYRSAQKTYAAKIAQSLRRRGAVVWFDEISIQPGDSIPETINRGLGWCTHMVLIVDDTFFESDWTKAEYESFLYRHLAGDHRYRYRNRNDILSKRAILPLFLVDPSANNMPPLLRRIRGIDCRQKDVRVVMNKLWNAISAVGPK